MAGRKDVFFFKPTDIANNILCFKFSVTEVGPDGSRANIVGKERAEGSSNLSNSNSSRDFLSL